jgi:O-antigen/teichoic acid export membrane protein
VTDTPTLTATGAVSTAPSATSPTSAPATGSLGAHATAMAGQLAAGIGNFGFALIAGRLLDPGAFAALAAFLAIYLLVHVPSASLGASAALDPVRLARSTRVLLGMGVALALATLVASGPLSSLLNLPVAMVVALAAAMPAASLLGVRRGVLYGTGHTTQVAASLAGEPAVRLLLGVPLILLVGATGGAIAVALGGWVGLGIAMRGRAASIDLTVDRVEPPRAATGFTAVAFFAFALIANQDLLVANSVLSPTDAGGFAVLSVIGSAVAFATATIPMVLLPAAATEARTDATRTALGATGAIAAAAVVIGFAVPTLVIGLAFGSDHLHVAPLLGPYLIAMGLLAIGRVLAAGQCAQGRGHLVTMVVGTAVVAHLAVLVLLARTPGQIVASTIAATALGAAALVAVPSLDRRLATVEPLDPDLTPTQRVGRWFGRPDVTLVTFAVFAAVVLRLIMTRGLWVDEAISVAQAQLPFTEMIRQLRLADVHPPLHHAILWLTVRVIGTGEVAVRLPSILAGAALVPVLYLLGRDLFDRQTARIAAVAGIVAPFLVWYSQEARMYSVFMLAATAAVLGQVRAMRTNSVADWTLYTLATAVMAWSQYFAVLPIAVQQVTFLAVIWQRRRDADGRRFALAWAGSLLALILLVLPMAPIALDQLSNYSERRQDIEGLTIAPTVHSPVGTSAVQQELSVYAALANGVWAVWGYHSDNTMAQIAAFWPVGMLVSLLMLGRGRSRDLTLLVALILVPAAVLFGAAVFKRDLFELRYFCGAVPLAILLASRAATRFGTSMRAKTVLGLALVAALTIGLIDQQLNGTNPRRYDFDGAIAAVEATWEPGAILLYEPNYLAEVVDYYGPSMTTGPITQAGSAAVSRAPVVYVLATERVINERETAARVGGILADLESDGRQIVQRIERANVTVWELR